MGNFILARSTKQLHVDLQLTHTLLSLHPGDNSYPFEYLYTLHGKHTCTPTVPRTAHFAPPRTHTCTPTVTRTPHVSQAGPTTAFGRVVGRQAYTKICAEQLCNICCEYHYITFMWFTTTVPKWPQAIHVGLSHINR